VRQYRHRGKKTDVAQKGEKSSGVDYRFAHAVAGKKSANCMISRGENAEGRKRKKKRVRVSKKEEEKQNKVGTRMGDATGDVGHEEGAVSICLWLKGEGIKGKTDSACRDRGGKRKSKSSKGKRYVSF